jgi:hypothetical protein
VAEAEVVWVAASAAVWEGVMVVDTVGVMEAVWEVENTEVE